MCHFDAIDDPVRYPQGGGLTAQRREARERLRLDAAERFAAGQENALVAKALRPYPLGTAVAQGLE